jgi:hypothetical protein
VINRSSHPIRVIILVTALVLTAALGRGVSCAQENPEGPATRPPAGKILGVWQGTTLAACNVSLLPDRCNAQQKVSITVVEGEGGKPTGYYKCAYGTQNCFHMNETGKVIAATITGAQVLLRVITPDGLSYVFTGHVSDDMVNGGYTCYSGGALLERGVWRARRTY